MKYFNKRLKLFLHKLGLINLSKFEESILHPIWLRHSISTRYNMTDEHDKDVWELVYYPLLEDGKTREEYGEPRALMRNINKPGFWSKEVPLRYLKPVKPNSDAGK